MRKDTRGGSPIHISTRIQSFLPRETRSLKIMEQRSIHIDKLICLDPADNKAMSLGIYLGGILFR
jgi:hypothetical protein